MHDIQFSKGRLTLGRHALERFHMQRMILSPVQWAACQLPIKLKWKSVKFSSANSKYVPNGSGGVYTFVVKPDIADHPACSYLLYVGKADKSFRERYYAYLQDKRLGDKSRRPHVEDMLSKWDGHLWFYYAEIDRQELIPSIEEILLAAYLPPTNKSFPGEVKRALQKFFGN
jgi:hypothetical protein